jgi:hypothetical protein
VYCSLLGNLLAYCAHASPEQFVAGASQFGISRLISEWITFVLPLPWDNSEMALIGMSALLRLNYGHEGNLLVRQICAAVPLLCAAIVKEVTEEQEDASGEFSLETSLGKKTLASDNGNLKDLAPDQDWQSDDEVFFDEDFEGFCF